MGAWRIVAGTGHRPQHLSLPAREWLRLQLPRIAEKLRREHGAEVGCSGMALGFDLWWADAILGAGLKLWAHIPFPQQPAPWRDEDQAEYHRLLGLASKVTTYGDHYDVKLLHVRNDGMARAADAVVAGWRASKRDGGTASAVRKAKDRNLPIVHLDPEARTSQLLYVPPIGAGVERVGVPT